MSQSRFWVFVNEPSPWKNGDKKKKFQKAKNHCLKTLARSKILCRGLLGLLSTVPKWPSWCVFTSCIFERTSLPLFGNNRQTSHYEILLSPRRVAQINNVPDFLLHLISLWPKVFSPPGKYLAFSLNISALVKGKQVPLPCRSNFQAKKLIDSFWVDLVKACLRAQPTSA